MEKNLLTVVPKMCGREMYLSLSIRRQCYNYGKDEIKKKKEKENLSCVSKATIAGQSALTQVKILSCCQESYAIGLCSVPA